MTFAAHFACLARLAALLALAGCANSIVPSKNVQVPPPTAFFTTADGTTLPLRRYAALAPRKALLLALHGFNDYSRFIEEPARYFAQQGIETIAYDQRGFGATSTRGQWAGAQLMADDFLAVLAQVKRDHPGVPLYVLGESMGASVIAVALARAPQTGVDGVIFVTPAVWSYDTMPWYQRFATWAGARMAPWFTISSTQFDITPTDNRAVRAQMAGDPLVLQQTPLGRLDGLTELMGLGQQALPQVKERALLLYGLRDIMMPRRPMIALFERWPAGNAANSASLANHDNFRYAFYPNGYHMLLRDEQRKIVWDDVLSWLLAPAAALPSGLERRRAELLPVLSGRP